MASVEDGDGGSVAGLPSLQPVRLPLIAEPEAGEGFCSWLNRAAVHSGCPPGTLARAIGLPLRVGWSDGARVAMLGVILPTHSAQRVAAATGLEVDELKGMHLQRYDGAAVSLAGLKERDERTLARLARLQWILAFASRACPACLSERPGVWPLWWRLASAAVCPDHKVVLLDRCPTCAVPFQRGSVGKVRGLSCSTIPALDRCGSRTKHGTCSQHLPSMPTTGASAVAVTAQRTVLKMLALSGHPSAVLDPPDTQVGRAAHDSGVDDAPIGEGFRRLYDTCALILAAGGWPTRFGAAAASSDDVEGAALTGEWERLASLRRGGLAYRAAPRTAALGATLLRLALPALTATTHDELASALQPWAIAYHAQCRQRRHDPLRAQPLRGAVKAAVNRSRPVTFRMIDPARRRLDLNDTSDGARTRPALTVEHRFIPQLLPIQAYNEHIVGFLPGTAPTTGRLFAALSAMRLAGASSWRCAALNLGVPPRNAIQTADVISRRVRTPDAYWDHVQTALDELLTQRRDYHFAHAQLAELSTIPAPIWHALAAEHGWVATAQRAQHAAAWVWAEVTSADWRDSPAHRTRSSRACQESRREGYRRFVLHSPPGLREALLDWTTTTHLLAGDAGTPHSAQPSLP